MPEYIISDQAYSKALTAAFSAGAKGQPGYTTDCLTDELVRCRDCVHYDDQRSLCSVNGPGVYVYAIHSGYCAWAEPKGEPCR